MSENGNSRFKILNPIGKGGMGVVYRALDRTLQREVALKFLPEYLSKDAKARERFLREARAASRLDHPNICTIYDIGETREGKLFISMALYSGETLWDKMMSGPMTIVETIKYGSQICQGLAAAHASGIIHRDIKPQNIFITIDDTVKILDFGIAKLDDHYLTKTGMIMGSIKFMSPEQMTGKKLDTRSDIWSLGVVLYRMLTGEFPFNGSDWNMVYQQILNTEPKSITKLRPELKDDMDRILTHCLQKEPDDRYKSADELQTDLQILNIETANASETTNLAKPEQTETPISKEPAFGKLFTFLLMLLIIVGVWLISLNFEKSIWPPKDVITLVVLPIEVDEKLGFSRNFAKGLLYSLTKRLKELENHRENLTVLKTGDVVAEKVASIEQARERLKADMVITGLITGNRDRKEFIATVFETETNMQTNQFSIDVSGDRIIQIQENIAEKLRLLLDIELPIDYAVDAAFAGTGSIEAFEMYQKGITYLEEGRSEESIDNAIRLFREAVKNDKNYVNAHAMLGIAYTNHFKETKIDSFKTNAIISARQALALEPNSSSARISLANVYIGTRDYDQAVSELQTVLKNDQNSAQAHRDLGKSYYYLKKPKLANQHYMTAVRMRPNYWEYYNALGFSYQAVGKHEEALQQYLLVLNLRPLYGIGHNNIGAQYEKLEAYSKALEYYKRAAELKNDSPRTRAIAFSNWAGCLFRDQLYAESIKKYERSRMLMPGSFAIWSNLANAYELAGQLDNARSIRSEIIRESEKKQDKLSIFEKQLLAEALARSGQKKSAQTLLDEVIKEAPKNWRILFGLTRTWTFLGEHRKALVCLEASIENGLGRSSVSLYKQWAGLAEKDDRFFRLLRSNGLL